MAQWVIFAIHDPKKMPDFVALGDKPKDDAAKQEAEVRATLAALAGGAR